MSKVVDIRDLGPLLQVEGLCKSFVSRSLFGPKKTVVAASDVSFQLDRGQAVALVGESGSGKSTVARLLLRLERADAGSIRLEGEDVLRTEARKATMAYRSRVQMVFQDPFGSLNPIHSVAHHLQRPLLRHHKATKQDVREKAMALLESVGLHPAEEFIDRHPYELSGGQRQRVAIARALAVEPALLVADEPTSMLDVSIRMGVLALLRKLKDRERLAILLITHDLASARYLADRILVLYRGRVVEDGPAAAVVESPLHPYTRALLASIAEGPVPVSPPKVESAAKGDAHGACPFAARCSEVSDLCWTEDPLARTVGTQRVRCHLYSMADVETAR